MDFPIMTESARLQRLRPQEGRIRVVLDTDAYKEIDDQFAVVYALQSPRRLQVEALYAAPFSNARSKGPADGMEKSYHEILRLLGMLEIPTEGLVFRGSPAYLPDYENPHRSDAALDLVQRAMALSDQPLCVVAIGAITNVASALLIEPRIIERILVIWTGRAIPGILSGRRLSRRRKPGGRARVA